MRRAGMAVVMCLAWPAAEPAPAPRLAPAETITREVLPNGARLIVQPRPGCGTFALELLAEGGSQIDQDSRYGLSTLLARMLMRGTSARAAARQALEVESSGATVQPALGPAAIGLRASGPASAIAAVLDVVGDAARAPLLSHDDVVREVALERQALRGSLDDPSASLERALRPVVYGSHPLGRVADPKRYLDGVDPPALRAAHAERFAGSRLVLVIVGDVPAEEALRHGRGALAPFPAGAPPAPIAPPVPLPAEARARMNVRTTQPMLFVGVPTAGLEPPEWPAMDLLTGILAGFQERLSTEIREKRGWAYWVTAEDRRYRAAGLFGILTAVPARRLEEAEAIVRRELERIASDPPAAEELDRARRIEITARARAWQRSTARAAAFAWRETRGLPPATFDEQEAALRAVTPADLTALAGRLLAASRYAVVTLR
jgi:zinc protease